MDWYTSYIGTRVALVAHSDEAYAILDKHRLTSWQAGGCAILATALHKLLPGSLLYSLRRVSDGTVDHVVVRFFDGYLDADGAYTGRGIVAKHEAMEGVRTRLGRVAPGNFGEGIVCPSSAVHEFTQLLKDAAIDSDS